MTQIDLARDSALVALFRTIAALTEGRECFLVGGAVRDGLMERPISDIDLAYDGDALAFARSLADALGGHFAPLDDERGTARVIIDDKAVRTVDVSRLRGDIHADLGARDYTIDAMASRLAPLARGESTDVLDLHGGISDLGTRTIRLVSENALIEDPLRLMRAVRLAVELDCEIEPSSEDALRRHARRITESAAERIRDELARALATPRAAHAVRLMDSLGLLDGLMPEVTAGRGVTQPKEHYYDVFEHNVQTLAALDMMLGDEEPADARERELHRSLWHALKAAPHVREYLREEINKGRPRAVQIKLAGLLHDVAKPQTRRPDETGRLRFFGHAELGAEMARSILTRLRFSRRDIDLVATMIDAHLRPFQIGQESPPTRRAMFRFFRDTGDAAEGVLLLSLADARAARGPRMTHEGWRQSVAYIAYLLSRRHEDESVVRPERLIRGDDVMRELGIAAGPNVGRILAAVEEAQAAGEVSTREDALEYVRRSAPKARLSGSRGSSTLAQVRAKPSVMGAVR
jgi:putative nucleotidyltransferase with HDIG domain